MSWIEEKYINLLSRDLKKFAKKTNNLYNFRCPYCGDSHDNPNKARGYLYYYKSEWRYKCHNCGQSTFFGPLLKFVNPTLFKEFNFERFSNNIPEKKVEAVNPFDLIKKIPKLDGQYPKISSLNEKHIARKYLSDRKIPEKFFSSLYYSEDLNQVKNLFDGYEETTFKKDNRILIPIFSRQKELIGINARAIGKVPHSERYVILKQHNDSPLIYGLERVDYNKKIIVVEGPFDSMFLENCVAVSGADLERTTKIFSKSQSIFVFDNQPRNVDVINKMHNLISSGADVVIWPPSLDQKDINDMVIAGFDPSEIIKDNTFNGLSAQLKLADWRKK